MKDSFEVDNGLIFALYPHIKEHIYLSTFFFRRKALPGFFSSLTCLKKPVFSKGGLPRWKVPARLYWEGTQPACHYF